MPAAGEEREASRRSPASLVFLVVRDGGAIVMFGTHAWAGCRTGGGLNTGFRSLGIIGRAIGCATIVTSAGERYRLKVQMKGGAGIS